MRARAALVAAVVAALAVTVPSAAARRTQAASAPGQVAHLVRATTGDGARYEDDLGRTVLLRGVNVNQIHEYATNAPGFAPTVPLTDDDLAGIAALGFDTVRLLVSWSRLEPAPGTIDDAYVATVRQWVEAAATHDLYVAVDMHQDAWGVAVGTPVGTDCPAPLTPNIGWDGAPAWATITDGLTTCRAQLRELAPAVAQAWTHFYVDEQPGNVRSHLVAVWGHLAGALADLPNIAGWDLLNEPNPGSITVGAAELALLGRYQDEALDAIRAAEASAPGGLRHVGLWEPSAEWSAFGVTLVQPPGFTDQTDLAFAPHLYADSITADRSLGITALSIAGGHDAAALVAGIHGVPYWSGEWGWFGDPAADGTKVREYGLQEDAHLAGGAWWSWKQACGDPHVVGARGASPSGISPSLVRISCPDGAELGIPAPFATVLSRAYPRAAPGHLLSLTSDADTGAMTLQGSAPGATGDRAALDLWVPDRGLGAPVVTGENVSGAVATPVAGGWRVRAVAVDDYRVDVRPATVANAADETAAESSRATGNTSTLPVTGGGAPVAVALVGLLFVLAARMVRRWT
jgi:endoglycosylceramidase